VTYDDVTVGEALPPLTVAITLQRLVMEAGANRDFARIHHDPDEARSSGAPAPYTNTTLVETLFEAGIRGWAGPAPRIRVLEFAMTDFNCVGDVVAASGTVTAKRDDERAVDLEIWIETDHGRTATGSATIAFPP
jgi:acyl dehydratase